VFYLGRDDGLIHRELRDLPTSGDRLGTAVGAVLNVAPLDPNYTSGWAAGQVNRATVKGNRITLDLSASAFSQFKNGEQVQRAIQQLVVTATAAVGDRTGDKSVRILVD
ncbi:RNA polymerase subunit sigma-70, partial [Xanthomonas citri pv. citri]|nr:RNA polymerase subunit sigma-70 [Xanthomonas citri pv. citri]